MELISTELISKLVSKYQAEPMFLVFLAILACLTNYIIVSSFFVGIILLVPWILYCIFTSAPLGYYLFPFAFVFGSVLVFYGIFPLIVSVLVYLLLGKRVPDILKFAVSAGISAYVLGSGPMVGIYISALLWHIASSIAVAVFAYSIFGGIYALLVFSLVLVFGYRTNVLKFTRMMGVVMAKTTKSEEYEDALVSYTATN